MWVFLYCAFFSLWTNTRYNERTGFLRYFCQLFYSNFVNFRVRGHTQDACQRLMTATHRVHLSTEFKLYRTLKLHSVLVNELLRDTGMQESSQ